MADPAKKNKLDEGIGKLPGGSGIDDFKRKYLDPYNIVGDPGDIMNLGGSGYDQAIQGAKDAQSQANALASLQWQRQMTGLGGALGYVDQMGALYNSLYGTPTRGGMVAPGGMMPAHPDPMALAMPTPPQQTTPTKVAPPPLPPGMRAR